MPSPAFSLDRCDGELEVFTDRQRLAARFVPSLRSRNDARISSRAFVFRWCKRAGARSVPGMIDRR
jgi:hypothetical protein